MKRRAKIAVVAGAAGALAAAGTGAGVAATDVLSPEERNEAVIEDAARQLGVEPAELTAALKQALENRIDEARADGRLTEEQANALKERLDDAGAPLVLGGFGRFERGGPFLGPGLHVHGAKLEAAASYLGLSVEELREQLAGGRTLAEIARAEGKSVDGLVQALVDEAERHIDEAEADGRLGEEQARELKEGLAERLRALVNGELRLRGPLEGRPFGRSFPFGGPGPDDEQWRPHRPSA